MSEHAETLQVVLNQSSLLVAKQQWDAAERVQRQLLEVQERILGPEHEQTLASLNNLGSLLARKGETASAARMFQRALTSSEHRFGSSHPLTTGLRAKLQQVQGAGTTCPVLPVSVALLNDGASKS
jgi:Tfp pilus assembly protein PilF